MYSYKRILHGTADELPITSYASSVDYCARHMAVSSAGCTLVPFEGLGHNFIATPVSMYSSVATYLDSFLFDHGYTGGIRSDISTYAFNAAEHCRFTGPQHLAQQTEYMLPECGCGPVW